jgi:asparagine synthetase B (glutamine-hydrolysing)
MFGVSSVEELVERAVAREAANVPALVMLAGGVDLNRALIEP